LIKPQLATTKQPLCQELAEGLLDAAPELAEGDDEARLLVPARQHDALLGPGVQLLAVCFPLAGLFGSHQGLD
jgi:hypothetical protein